MTGKAILLFLFLFSLSATLCAQQDKDQYLQQLAAFERLVEGQTGRHVTNPLDGVYETTLDTIMQWYVATVTYGYNGGFRYKTNIYNTHNELVVNENKCYFKYSTSTSGGGWYLREDTINRKIYLNYNQPSQENAILLYDFSLQVGDSIVWHNFFPNYYLRVDSIKIYNLMGFDRRVFFLRPCQSESYNRPIWVEGIGSLADFLEPYNAPSLTLHRNSMNCVYKRDTLIYQTNIAQTYGCSFEGLDQIPPQFHQAWFDRDTVAYNDTINLYVRASDASGMSYVMVVLKTESSKFYRYTEFQRLSNDLFKFHINELIPAKFWNEVGDWWVVHIYLCDSASNETNIVANTIDQARAKFYVSAINGIEETTTERVLVFPNPLSRGSKAHVPNPEGLFQEIVLYSVEGQKILHQTLPTGTAEIDTSGLSGGIYFYQLKSNRGLPLYTGKLIVN